MKTTKAVLGELDIHNPHNLAKAGDEPKVYIDYIPSVSGRAGRYARWIVGRIGYKTNPKGHWEDNYNKTFTVRDRAAKEPERLAAIEWASKRYGISKWEKSPFGSYHPKGTLAKVTTQAAASPVKEGE